MNVPETSGAFSAARAEHGHGAADFRDDIEGLRGVAVGSVVAFHAFPSALPGGFIGVDVFFVISGYLITRLLLREIERTGGIDLAAFWARRVRRILPAATLVLCATALVALAVPATDARLLGRHIVAAALFYYNWRQAGEAVNYLASDDRDNVLLHYWSLAVEEQFYLFWPLLLAGLIGWQGRRGARMVVKEIAALAAVLIAVSLAACVYQTAASAPYGFFATYARAWQLLSGALVAVATLHGPVMNRPVASWVGGASAVALLASFALISRAVAYPGIVAAVPTGATALLIASGASAGAATAGALAVAPLRYVGRISYSWYLWHWPAIAFAGLAFGDWAAGPWAAIAVSFVLAAASYRLVELPLRFDKRLVASKRTTMLFGAALIALGAATGVALRFLAQDATPIGGGKYASRTAIEKDRAVIYAQGCLLRLDDMQQPPCVYGDAKGERTLVLLGDSHAGNWFTPIDAAARAAGWRLVVRAKAACHPIAGPQRRADGQRYRGCEQWLAGALDGIEALKPDLTIVASVGLAGRGDGEREVLERLAAIAPVVAMRATPTLPEAPTRCLRRSGGPEGCAWRLSDIRGDADYPETPVAKLPGGTRVLDLNDRVCPGGVCGAVIDGRVVATDTHHLTASFSATMTDAFATLLRSLPHR